MAMGTAGEAWARSLEGPSQVKNRAHRPEGLGTSLRRAYPRRQGQSGYASTL